MPDRRRIFGGNHRDHHIVCLTVAAVIGLAACGGSGGGADTQSESASGDIREASPCDNVGERAEVDGLLLECTTTNNGTFWHAVGSASGDSGDSGDSGATLGSACEIANRLQWSVFGVLICDGGTFRYAVPDDFPAAPPGGYTSRPDWYPTITQILGSGKPEPECDSSQVAFSHPVVPLDRLTTTIPYGAMIGDHVTPIDHAYLGITSLSIPDSQRTESDYVDVTAPGDGTITELSSLGAPSTNRVTIDHGCGVYSVYMVLNRPSGVLAEAYEELTSKGGYMPLSIPITAGEVFGQQRDNALDFNVFDGSTWLSGFVNPASYLTGDTWKPYTADYLPFFSGDIRDAMTNSLQRTSQPRIGKIDHDVAKTASGNWFLDGTFGYGGKSISDYLTATSPVQGGPVEGKNSYSWSHLSISPHEVDTSRWIFSIGWFKDPKGDFPQMVLDIPVGSPTPDALTSANGPVVYDLYQLTHEYPGSGAGNNYDSLPVGYSVGTGQPQGQVVLQVNSDGSLSVEFGSSFTSKKRVYRR